MKSTESVNVMEFEYKNFKGEIQKKTVVPYELHFGTTVLYEEKHWLLKAFDTKEFIERNFVMKNIIRFF